MYGDSALVIHKLRGEWEIRDHKLIPYQTYIKELAEFFNEISFHHVPREENQMHPMHPEFPETKTKWSMRSPL